MTIEQTTRGSNRDYRRPDNDIEAASRSTPRPSSSIDEVDSAATRRRCIQFNSSHQGTRFLSNHITTAKYNLWTFLPKFLFEQFRRYANIFFLCIGLLQQIPNVSPTGRFVTIVPFTVILVLTAIKEIIEDVKRHRADGKVNNSSILVLSSEGRWQQRPWKDVVVGDIVMVENGRFFPADLVLLASSEPQAMCYIETSNLDGETNLKIRSGLSVTANRNTAEAISQFHGVVECEPPNRNLYDFKGNISVASTGDFMPIAPSSILLRGAKLMNTGWVFGIAVYTGHETKLLMNSTKAPLKRSNIDKITNFQIIFLFFILIVVSLLSATFNELQKHDGENHSVYLGDFASSHFFHNLLTFVILYNNLIPISLQVTLEFVKFIQAYFINWDKEMFYAPTQTPAMARTSNLNEELGQIKYIFSDKTGTLTRNIMEFKKSSIAGNMYEISANGKDESQSALMENLKTGHETAADIDDFLVLMAVCHTVVPEETDEGTFYNASSPDEKALVEGAARYGYEFVARNPGSVVVKTPFGSEEEYKLLNVIEFTSTRKRMTVIVRTPTDEIKLYTKGADTMILERLGDNAEDRRHQAVTLSHLEEFAKLGLRTLCLATRTIAEEEYRQWALIHHKATTNIENKQQAIDDAAELIETNLMLLGATAIEDKLQDGVPETISQLLEANIHIWMLTGDKQETAINIGHSCSLLKENMPIIIINSNTLDDTRAEITEQLNNFRRGDAIGKDNDVAVVVDGKTLTFALNHSLRKDFLDLCCSCQSVICCRVSPIQKAEMVELVQENTGAISLAIGDGANDVAMIQKANVGVGISGNEGLQAANSSDFAIAQFKYLSRLLLVHGAWNYSRISKVILYSFYKNICLYIIELWFAFYNHWSGQVLFERWTIGLYNIIFTSCPPVVMGLFDQYCTDNTRIKYPSLYHSTQNSEFFNHKIFWLWMANALIHSILLYWLPMTGYNLGCVWSSGLCGDYLVVGNIVYSFVVVTVCLKAGMEMDAWSWVTHASVWGSMLVWFVFLVLYSYFWPAGIPLAANMAGMCQLVFSSPLFWFGLVLVPSCTLLPDVIYKAVKVTVFTTESDRVRIAEIMEKDVGPYVDRIHRTGLRLTEVSSLLRNNVRKVFKRHSPKRQRDEMEMKHGYAFSQEEGGAVSQVEYIRRKSEFGGHSPHPPPRIDRRIIAEENDEEKYLIAGEEHFVDHPSAASPLSPTTNTRVDSKTYRLTAKQGELPRPQSPLKVDVKVTRMKTNKSYAQSASEIVPLTASGHQPKSSDSDDQDESAPGAEARGTHETHV